MSISGEWAGVYVYGGRQSQMKPIQFHAVFSPQDIAGNFVGHITDADGIGEAVVTGTQVGSSFQFIKTYRATRYKNPLPILYKGTFSEDGQRLQGSWHIERKLFWLTFGTGEGMWRAQRPDLPEPPLVWPPPPQASDG